MLVTHGGKRPRKDLVQQNLMLDLLVLQAVPCLPKTKITPVPASQADEVSDLILVRSRLAHAWPQC